MGRRAEELGIEVWVVFDLLAWERVMGSMGHCCLDLGHVVEWWKSCIGHRIF